MPDYTRSEYLKIMFGNNSASSGVNNFTAPSQINDLGGASIDETSLAVQHASEDMSQYMNEAQKASTESKGRAEQRNGWQRFSDTTQDMVNDVTQGFLGFFDSIGDLALNSFEAWGWMDENKAEQYKNTDWMAPVQKALGFIDGSALRSGDMFTSDYWTSWSPEEARAYLDMQDRSSYASQMDSGLNNFGKGILVNFGNMIPSMLASLLPGGQALSLATLGAGAFASNTNEQYERNKQENYGNGDRGKQFGRAALGGVADAAVEVGTEILVGKALGLVGKGLSKGASKLTGKNINIQLVNPESNVGGFNVSKQMVDRLREGSAKFVPYLLRTMNEEGAEEVISGILDPVVNQIGGASKDEVYSSKEGKINRYADVSFWLADQNSVAMQGLSGAVSGGIMGAMSQARSYNYAKSLNIGKDGVNALVELDDIKEGLHSDNYKSQAEVDSAITSFANHLMNGSMTTTQKKNFLRLINDPAGYMTDVTEKQISDAVDNYARKYSDTDNLIASDLVDTLNTTFGKNYTLQFSDDPKMTDKANVNFLTKTITLNEKYKNQYSELIAHEYLGHIATDTLTKSQASRIAGEIKSTQWWKDNRDVLEKAYSEFTADGKENEFNSELIANWLEDVISDGNTNGNLKTSAVLNELLSYRGIKEKLLQKLKHTDADNLLKNDSILAEYMKGINKVLSRGDRFGGKAKADSAYEDYILGKAGMQTKYAAKEWDSNRLKKITDIAARDYGMNNSNPGFSFGKNFKSKGLFNEILSINISNFSSDINEDEYRKDKIISAFKSGEAYLEEAGGAYFRGHIDDDGGIVIDSISDEPKPLEEEKVKVSTADAKQSAPAQATAPTPSAPAAPAAPAGKNYGSVTSVDVSGDFASMAKPFGNDTNKLLDWLSKNVKGNKDVLKELDEKGTAKIGDITVTGSVTETMAKITDVKQDSVQQVQQTTQVQQALTPQAQKDVSFITGAPYRLQNITAKNKAIFSKVIGNKYLGKANEIAKSLGITISGVQSNLGGYSSSVTSTDVNELSYTFKVECSKEEADLFGAMLADLGHDSQEATISSSYVPKDKSGTGNGYELSIKLKSIDGVSDILREAGITDYTIHEGSKEATVYVDKTDNINDVNELRKKIKNALMELIKGGKADVSTKEQYNEVDSRYLSPDARRRIYRVWLDSRKDLQDGKLYKSVQKADRLAELVQQTEPVYQEYTRINTELKKAFPDKASTSDLDVAYNPKTGKVMLVENEKSRLFFEAADNILKLSQAYENETKEFFGWIASRNGLTFDARNSQSLLKSRESIADRLYRNMQWMKDGQDVFKLKDLIRTTFIFNDQNIGNFDKLLNDLSPFINWDENDGNPISIKDGKQGDGYLGLHFDVKFQNIPIEIQIHTDKSWNIKLAQDKAYDTWRSQDEAKLTDAQKAQKMLDEADSMEKSLELYKDKSFRELCDKCYKANGEASPDYDVLYDNAKKAIEKNRAEAKKLLEPVKSSKPRGTSITLLAKVKNSVLASKAFADENSLKSFLNKEIRGSDDVRNRLMNDGKAEINGYEVTAHKTAKGNLVIDDIKNTQVTESTTESTGSKSESVSDSSNIEKTAEAEEKGNEEVPAPTKEETKETQPDYQIVPKAAAPHTITELAESIPEQASNEEYRKALNDFIGRLSKEERGVLIGDTFDNDEDAQSNYKGELVDGKYRLVFNASDYEEEYKRWSGNPNSSSHAPKPEDYVSLQYANEEDTSTQSQTASSGSIVPPSIGESASQSAAESSVPELTYHETKKDAFYDDPRYIKMWADLHAKKKIDKTTVREFIKNLSHVLQTGSEIEFSDHSAEWAQEVFKYINTIGSENDRTYAIHDLATEIVRQIASDANLSHEDNLELLDNMTKAVEAEVRKLVQVSSMDTYRSQMEQRVRTWQTRYHNLVVRSQMWNECRNKEGTLYNFYNRTNQKNLSPEEVAVSQSFKGIAPKNPASRSGLTPTPSLVKNFAYAAENYCKLGEEVKRRASANETPLLYVHDEQLQKDLDYLHDWFMQNSHKIDENGPDTLDNRQLNSNMRTQALPNEVIEKMTNVYGGILGMFNDAAVERRSRALKAATTANVVTEQNIKTSVKKKSRFNFIRKVRDLAMSPVTYLETYLGKEHPFTKLFRDDFTKARVAMQSRDLEYSNAINEVLESNGVRGRDFRKKVDFAGQRMTKDTLASIYMTIRTRENDIFADGEKHKFSLVDDSGSHKTFIEVSTDDLKVIEQLLTPNELKAVNEITEKVQAMSRPQYEEYYRKSYGLEPNTIEGIYFATRADTGQAKIDLNDGNTHSPYLTTAGAGYSNSRKGGNTTILRIKGFASTINGYYRDLDYRTTHFEAVEKARVLLNTKINGQTLSQRLGQVLPYWNTGENQWSQYILGIMVDQREWANQNDVFTKLTGKAQSAVLGLNLSPVLKQFLSGFTTMGEVGVTNYAKALPKMAYNLAHFKEAKAEMLKSIDSFRVRVEDQGALKGEISSDAISTIQKYCGAMMEKTDTANNVICVYSIAQVMADSGMGDVGEIFTSLLYRTQSNNMATWVSPLRSGYAGTITRMIFGIFGADNQNKLDLAMQVTSEFSNARRRRADYDAVLSDPNLDPNTRAEVESLRNESAKTYSAGEERKKAIGLSVALLLNGLFATAIADLMKRILGKKDWDEPTDAGEFAKDVAFESTLGWVPYIGTIASAVRNNTDASIITLDQINEVIQGAESFSKALSSRDPNAIGKEGSILAARITETLSGIPINNIYRYSRGIAKGVGNIFGNGQKIYYSKAFSWYANYSSAGMLDNFKKQVGRGNISMGADTLGALYDSYKLGAPSREDMVAISKLYQSGHTDILPKSVPDYYTNKEGEKEYLTQSQKDTFVKNYKGANDVVNIILKRPSITDEQKAKAIKRVYDAYYEYAKAKLTGDEPDSKLAKMIASGLFSPQDLAKAMEVYSIACDMKETSRASRKAQVVNLVNRSGLTRVQKLYLMSYLGYTLDDSAQKMLDRYVKQKTAH